MALHEGSRVAFSGQQTAELWAGALVHQWPVCQAGKPSGEDPDSGGGVAVANAKPKIALPPEYVVVLHNDDYSTMEFVIEVLTRFFSKTQDEALEITLRVHREGRGVAGRYSLQIAETKVYQVTELARSRGFPLRCTVENA